LAGRKDHLPVMIFAVKILWETRCGLSNQFGKRSFLFEFENAPWKRNRQYFIAHAGKSLLR
jgi:hypothetical protein